MVDGGEQHHALKLAHVDAHTGKQRLALGIEGLGVGVEELDQLLGLLHGLDGRGVAVKGAGF